MSTPAIVEAVYERGVLRLLHPVSWAERTVVQVHLLPDTANMTEHPHVTRTPGTCGGRPVIRGTRIPVKTLVGYHRMGYTSPEILAGFPDLSAAQLFDALSYYYDHQAEIDADIAADDLPAILERFHLKMNEDGILRPVENQRA